VRKLGMLSVLWESLVVFALGWTGLMVVCADIFIMVGVDWCSHCEVFFNSGRDIAVPATSSTTLVSIDGLSARWVPY
jgi:hypothetical protein